MVLGDHAVLADVHLVHEAKQVRHATLFTPTQAHLSPFSLACRIYRGERSTVSVPSRMEPDKRGRGRLLLSFSATIRSVY